jgi:hypothetical protein
VRAAGFVSLHGGLATIAGRRVVLVGDAGVGKTTLLLRLLHDGHVVEGDEMVLTKDGEAMAVARNLHVKQGTAALVPELARNWDSLPATATSAGATIRAFSPSDAGFGWQLALAPVDVAVLLVADHGERASTRPLTSVELVRGFVDHAAAASESRPALLRALSSLLGQAGGIELTVGDLSDSAQALVAALP